MPAAPSVLRYPQQGVHHRPPKSDLHPTSGLAGNWALDFMAAGGTPVLSPEAGTIWKLSGHDPRYGVIGGDILGWNVYVHTRKGILYFCTHLGDVRVRLGATVKAGTLIGHVCHWPHDEGRSHTHLGVTHPAGSAQSKTQIVRVSNAPFTP